MTYEPAPAGALDGSSGGVELLLEGVEAAESVENGFFERAISKGTSVTLAFACSRSKVLPEERVVNVT